MQRGSNNQAATPRVFFSYQCLFTEPGSRPFKQQLISQKRHDMSHIILYYANDMLRIKFLLASLSVSIIIVIIIIVSFMQGSHTHIPGANHVPRGYIVAATLSLLFMVPLCLVPALALLFFYVSTFRSMCAVPNVAVFCSSLTTWFPGMSRTYFLNDSEMVPVAPIITGITLVFTFHMRCISIVRSLYFIIIIIIIITITIIIETVDLRVPNRNFRDFQHL